MAVLEAHEEFVDSLGRLPSAPHSLHDEGLPGGNVSGCEDAGHGSAEVVVDDYGLLLSSLQPSLALHRGVRPPAYREEHGLAPSLGFFPWYGLCLSPACLVGLPKPHRR